MDITDFKEKLDRVIFERTQAIEQKKNTQLRRLQKIEKIQDHNLKKRLLYNAEKMSTKEVTASAEERELHEAYQFLIREYEARHNVSNNFLTPQPSKKRRSRRSSEVVSVYRGEKDFYEKVNEALPHEASSLEGSLCVGLEELLQHK